MEGVGFIAKKACMFTLKFAFTAFVLFVIIAYARAGYCYYIASTSAEQLLPQVARYVAEDNGLVYDTTNNPYADILGNNDTSVFGNANVAGANSRTYQYYIPASAADFRSGTQVGGHEPAVRVYKVDDTTKTNICEANITGTPDSHSVVQRGEILTVEVNVYATINFGFDFDRDGSGPLQTEVLITKSMAVPAVKYYRGLP